MNTEIELKKDGTHLDAVMHGRIDTATSAEAESILIPAIEGIDDLVLDFEDIQYISSAGLRVLLLVYKKMAVQGEMKLIHVNEMVREVLDITGFLDIMNVE